MFGTLHRNLKLVIAVPVNLKGTNSNLNLLFFLPFM